MWKGKRRRAADENEREWKRRDENAERRNRGRLPGMGG